MLQKSVCYGRGGLYRGDCARGLVSLKLHNPLTPTVKPWVIQSFLTFDFVDRTVKCDYSLESF